MPSPRPLDPEVKRRRGTLKPGRERKRASRRKPDTDAHPVSAASIEATSRDYVAIAHAYVADVLTGRIVAGKWVRKACARFQRDLELAERPDCPFMWSPAHVHNVCSWIAKLPHIEGTWSSPTIELQPWQVWILAACYGFRRRSDGGKRITSVFFEVSRKSAKSTLVAAAALYHLAVEQEPGAQVICGASTGSQARIVFGIAQKMVRASAWLRELGFTAWANSITFGETGGHMKPVNSKSSTQDGLSPSFICLDESHAQSHALHDVLKSAMGARQNGVLWAPTTAGYDLLSVGYALRQTAQKILDAVVENDHTFAVLYELDEGDDWRDESVWIKSAPMVGITPTLDYLRRYCLDAQQTPSLEGEFQVKVCNRWLHGSNAWLSMAAWDRCADSSLRLEQFRRERCWIGADLAERDDLAAVALLFKRADVVYAFVRCYLPKDVVEERARAVPEYRAWVKAGLLVMTDGNLTDFALIERDIRTVCTQFDVQEIVIERYGALNLIANLSNDGLPARVEVKNSKSFTPPSLELEARIKAGKFRHDGNSLLKWAASNCHVERRVDGSLLPKKAGPESPEKIDPIDAVLLALSAMLAAPAPVEYRILAL